jgi:putative ABC transport system ATP-binding protein
MDNGSEPLIRLDSVSKVFVTDEVETHALAGIHFEVKKGEYLSGHPAAANRRCSPY